MIKWEEKGWKATGLHHAAVTEGSMAITWYFLGVLPSIIVGAIVCGWYIGTEYHQNGIGLGLDKSEPLDWLTPLMAYIITVALIKRALECL